VGRWYHARMRGFVALIFGFVLGVVAMLVSPDLLYERRTVSLAGENRVLWSDLQRAVTQDGWRVVRVDNDVLYQLERPRLRLPSSDVPRAAAKPTEAPKPATSPR